MGDDLVRQEVRLEYGTSTQFDQWRLNTAAQLGVRRVTAQEVLSHLVTRLVTDDTFSRQTVANLRKARKETRS